MPLYDNNLKKKKKKKLCLPDVFSASYFPISGKGQFNNTIALMDLIWLLLLGFLKICTPKANFQLSHL